MPQVERSPRRSTRSTPDLAEQERRERRQVERAISKLFASLTALMRLTSRRPTPSVMVH